MAIVPGTEYRVPGTTAAPRSDTGHRRNESRGLPGWASVLGPRYSVLGTWQTSRHDTHVSHTRLVLEDKTIALRVRLFHDDLTLALKAFSHQSELKLTSEARGDSLFGAYYAQHVKLEVNGKPVTLRVTASGMEEDDAAQQVVWYVLEASLDRPASKLLMLNGLLFDAFKDQQNIVQLLRLPGDTRQTLYFTAVDPREQAVSF